MHRALAIGCLLAAPLLGVLTTGRPAPGLDREVSRLVRPPSACGPALRATSDALQPPRQLVGTFLLARTLQLMLGGATAAYEAVGDRLAEGPLAL